MVGKKQFNVITSEIEAKAKKEVYELAYGNIKKRIMDVCDLDEEDMMDDSTEDQVNRETDASFKEIFGIEYQDI